MTPINVDGDIYIIGGDGEKPIKKIEIWRVSFIII